MKKIINTLCISTLLFGVNYTLCLAQNQQEAGSPPPAKNKEISTPKNQEPLPTPESGNAPPAPPYNLGQSLSPTTQNLVNSINASVNLYTGTANVSIPICTLPAEGINIPISLNYTAGNGVKVDDDAEGMVGQGWNLQAGGMITRMVRGLPDEDPNGYAGANNKGAEVERFLSGTMTGSANRQNYINKIASEELDSESDIFYFVLPTGLSGKFVLQPNGVPMTIPYQPITIKPAIGRAAVPTQNYWEIITQDGLKYTFGQGNGFVETTEERIKMPNENDKVKTYKSTWNINNIKSVENAVLATFTYEFIERPPALPIIIIGNPPPSTVGYQSKSAVRYIQHKFIETYRETSNCDNCPSLEGLKTVTITNTIKISVLRKIQTSHAALNFYTDNWDCISAIFNNPDDISCKFRVWGITMSNIANTYQKSWQLQYNYFPDNKRTKLVSIKPNDASATEFFYNETVALPPPNTFTAQQDWWGYYNSNPHPTLLPPHTIGTTQYPGADRSPDEAKTQAYILKKIVNPLGAVTEFEYENHRYNSSGTEKLIGGVRIKKLITKTNDTPQAKTLIKNYLYKNENQNISSGVVLQPFEYRYREQHSNDCRTYTWIPLACVQGFDKIVSSPLNGWSSADYIAYNSVIESIPQMGKTITTFTSVVENPDKNDMLYTAYLPGMLSNDALPYGYPRSKHSFQHRRGLPKSSIVYDENGNKKVIKLNTYQFDENRRCNNLKSFYSVASNGTSIYGTFPFLSHFSDISESITLSRTEEIVYDQTSPYTGGSAGANDYLRSDVGYSYTADNQPKEVRKILPTGEVLITRTAYAKDAMTENNCIAQQQTCQQQCPAPVQITCVEDCTEQYAQCLSNFEAGMQNNEMSAALKALLAKGINAPVETTTWIQRIGQPEKLLSASLTTYKKFGNFVRAYQNYQLRVKANNLPTNVSFTAAKINAYSGAFEHDAQYELLETNEYNSTNGLATENKPNNGQPSAIVYDNLKTPIAKVANAKANQIHYTSFEEGFWTSPFFMPNAVEVHNDSKTGNQRYNLAFAPYWVSSSFYWEVSDASIKYLLSYWHKPNASATWQLVEENLTYAQLQNKVISGTGWIDELRVHPVDALMTSTTYKPLIGKTSETDANNRTVYYEYDNLHRLKYVKDEKQNILEVYKYNLAD
jgi:hypothetical protein